MTINLKADLHHEDDEGRNWALLSGATDPSSVKRGAVLKAGSEHFRSWVRIDAVDPDGQVHFHQISATEARQAGHLTATG